MYQQTNKQKRYFHCSLHLKWTIIIGFDESSKPGSKSVLNLLLIQRTDDDASIHDQVIWYVFASYGCYKDGRDE